MHANNKEVVANFIEEVWNQRRLEKLDMFLSEDFVDHSLPAELPADKNGMKLWILGTGKAFVHRTEIEDVVCESDKVMLRLRVHLKHIGVWRGIEPTEAEVSAVGYRSYRLQDGKITEHWGLLDGSAIEAKLRRATKEAKPQV